MCEPSEKPRPKPRPPPGRRCARSTPAASAKSKRIKADFFMGWLEQSPAPGRVWYVATRAQFPIVTAARRDSEGPPRAPGAPVAALEGPPRAPGAPVAARPDRPDD